MNPEDEVRRALRLVSTLLKIAGITQKQLDVRLGQGRGYSSQVLTGRVALKYKHLLTMLEVLDVQPKVFFSILHHGPEGVNLKDNDVVKLIDRLHTVGFITGDASVTVPGMPATPPMPADPAELARVIRTAIAEALGIDKPTEGKPPAPRKPRKPRKKGGPAAGRGRSNRRPR